MQYEIHCKAVSSKGRGGGGGVGLEPPTFVTIIMHCHITVLSGYFNFN